jgi:hypothetical protein
LKDVMSLTRRGFFGVTLGVLLTPLLKCLPTFTPTMPCTLAAENATTLAYILPAVCDDFFKSAPLLGYLKSHERLMLHVGEDGEDLTFYRNEEFRAEGQLLVRVR